MNEKFYSFFARYGLIIVLIIAIFFRFYNLTITPPGLYPDEAMDGTNAQEALSTGHFNVFYPENNGREGLFINIEAVFLKIFKVNEPWVLRSVSAIFGTLTILGIYLLIYYIFRRKPYAHFAAFLPSFFTAISFWHVNFSRISFRAIMAPAFMVWALYLLVVTLERLRGNPEDPGHEPQAVDYKLLILSMIGGFVYGLGMHSYIAYRATPIIIIFVYLLYRWLYKVDLKKLFVSFVIFVAASLVAFAPLGIYFLKNPADFLGRTSQLSITSSATLLKDLTTNIIKTLGMFNIRGDGNWRHNFSGAPEIYWIVGIFFIIGILLGIKFLIRKRDDDVEQPRITDDQEIKLAWLVSIAWLITAMLPVIISNEGIPHALRSLLIVPPAYILAGLGTLAVTLLVFKKARLAFVYPIMLLIAVTLVAQSYITYFILWANNPNVADAFSQPYVNIARQLNQIGPSIKKYIVVDASGVLVRGIPMPSQTIMFLTDTFTPDKQKQKNLYYILPGQESSITDKNSSVIFYMEPKNNGNK